MWERNSTVSARKTPHDSLVSYYCSSFVLCCARRVFKSNHVFSLIFPRVCVLLSVALAFEWSIISVVCFTYDYTFSIVIVIRKMTNCKFHFFDFQVASAIKNVGEYLKLADQKLHKWKFHSFGKSIKITTDCSNHTQFRRRGVEELCALFFLFSFLLNNVTFVKLHYYCKVISSMNCYFMRRFFLRAAVKLFGLLCMCVCVDGNCKDFSPSLCTQTENKKKLYLNTTYPKIIIKRMFTSSRLWTQICNEVNWFASPSFHCAV